MWGLVVQPLEVLHHIFTYVDVQDTRSLSLTCRHLHNCIQNDDLLWKEHYLKRFDGPSEAPPFWKPALRDLLQFQYLLKYGDRMQKDEQLYETMSTMMRLATATRDPNPIHNQAFLAKLLASRSNKSAFLSRSSLFQRAGHPLDTPADTEALRQLSAKLFVYSGVNVELNRSELEPEGSQRIHPYARARVYDLRRYTTKNEWAPLMDDGSGRVDWEKVQAIVMVLICGLPVLSRRFGFLIAPFWSFPFHGLQANSFTEKHWDPITARRDRDELADRDPYNITGTWVRMVNFLDYHDLFAYNFQSPLLTADQERPPISTKEAIRLIWMNFKVTSIEEPQEGDDPNMPRVHFKGESKSLTNSWDPNANSGIGGFVRKTIHGDIRWTTVSVVHGEERWRSESIQIGGPNSARGTVGNWFDKNYDPHGPAGPTAFWKLSDGLLKPNEPSVARGFMTYQHLHLDQDEDEDEDEDDDSYPGDDDNQDDDEDDDDDDDDDEDEDDRDDETDDTDGPGRASDTITFLPSDVLGLPPGTEITITVTDGVITSVSTREV